MTDGQVMDSARELLFSEKAAVSTSAIEIDVKPEVSVYKAAMQRGQSLKQFVEADPDLAVMVAERHLAYITDRLESLPEDVVLGPGGRNLVQRESLAVDSAAKQLAQVKEYAFAIAPSGKRKDTLLESMYNRAVQKGDMRAATYLIDLVDNRSGKEKTTTVDWAVYNVYQILHSLFSKQLEVLNAGNGTSIVCCSRRSGKTDMLVALCLVEALRRPRTDVLYIGETAMLADALFNSTANGIIDRCGLKDSSGERLNWRRLDNGSTIMVRGLLTTKDPDLLRGFKYKVVVIDEFFHLKSHLLEYTFSEVLQPMQMDYADDYKLVCVGTPPRVKNTYGEYAWNTWECAHFSWTWEDNPHPVSVEERRAYIDNVLAEKGLDYNSAYVKREYFGEWCYDDDLLLYPDFVTWNVKEAVPNILVTRVLFGIDYGVSDSDALIGIAWNDSEKRGYVFYESKFSRLDMAGKGVSQLERLRMEIRKAWTVALDFFTGIDRKEANKRILWDADSNDQHITDDLRMNLTLSASDSDKDLRLNIQNAVKADRILMYDKIRELLHTGGLLLPEGGKTVMECESTIMKRGPNGEIYPEIDSTAFHPDLLPAMRYALYNALGV